MIVTELSPLGRHAGDLGQLLDDLDDRSIALRILNLGIDTRTPAGRLVYTIIAAVAAMERELLVDRTMSGLAAARAGGRVGGRRRPMAPEQIKRGQRLYDEGQLTAEEVARVVGVSRATVYRYLKITVREGESA